MFLKETTDQRVHEVVLADRHFLAAARHAFLIRRPDEIAASLSALAPDMRSEDIGLEALHQLHAAVRDAGGHPPVVIDSGGMSQAVTYRSSTARDDQETGLPASFHALKPPSRWAIRS